MSFGVHTRVSFGVHTRVVAAALFLGLPLAGTAVGQAASEVWVSGGKDSQVVRVFDAQNLGLLAEINTVDPADGRPWGGPGAMAVGKQADGSAIVVVYNWQDDRILFIDPDTRTIDGPSIPSPVSIGPRAAAYANGSKIQFGDSRGRDYFILDVASRSIDLVQEVSSGGYNAYSVHFPAEMAPGDRAYALATDRANQDMPLSVGTLSTGEFVYPLEPIGSPPSWAYYLDVKMLPGDETRALALRRPHSWAIEPVLIDLLQYELGNAPLVGAAYDAATAASANADRMRVRGDYFTPHHLRFESPSEAWVLGVSSDRQGALFFKVDLSVPTAPAVTGLVESSPGTFDFPTAPTTRETTCLDLYNGWEHEYEIVGNRAYVLTCDRSSWPGTASIQTWRLADAGASYNSESVEFPLDQEIDIVVLSAASLPAQAQQLLNLVQALADLFGPSRLASAGDGPNASFQSLIAKVEGVIDALERNNHAAAGRKLGAFINEVEALIRSRQLTEEQGRPLVDKAQSIIDQL